MKYGWENYLVIENEFIEAKRYLSFDRPANFEADSPFLHNQIVLLGSLVEIAMKKLIDYHNPEKSFSPGNINEYKQLLLTMLPDMEQYQVRLLNTETLITPFANWSSKKLQWWEAYNQIKHGSSRLPKLDHALNALAAYEILLHLIHVEYGRSAGGSGAFYPFREMPRLLGLQFVKYVGQNDELGYGFAKENYKICENEEEIKKVIDQILQEREEKKKKKEEQKNEVLQNT